MPSTKKVITVSPLQVIVNHPWRPYLHTQTHTQTLNLLTHTVPATRTPDPAACLGLSSHKTGCPPLERFSSHHSEGQDGELYLPLHPCQLLLFFWSIFLDFLLSFYPSMSGDIITRHVESSLRLLRTWPGVVELTVRVSVILLVL